MNEKQGIILKMKLSDNQERIYTCSHCGKQAFVPYENSPADSPLPEGWNCIKCSYNDQYDFFGYLCNACIDNVNKPFSYSIEVNGEVVRLPKTITPFKDKDGSAI